RSPEKAPWQAGPARSHIARSVPARAWGWMLMSRGGSLLEWRYVDHAACAAHARSNNDTRLIRPHGRSHKFHDVFRRPNTRGHITMSNVAPFFGSRLILNELTLQCGIDPGVVVLTRRDTGQHLRLDGHFLSARLGHVPGLVLRNEHHTVTIA